MKYLLPTRFLLVIPETLFLLGHLSAVMNDAFAANRVSSAYARAKGSDENTTQRVREYALRFLPIVKSEVLRFKMRVPRHIELEELHGVAICGLMKAFARYDGEDEEAFGGYVRQRVRGSILDELRRLDSLTRTSRRKARLYDETVQRIEQREGRLATEEEIRAELGLSAEEFADWLEQLRPITFFSIDEPAHEDASGLVVEKIEDPNEVPVAHRMECDELLALLRERLEALPEIQRKVLHMYYFKDFRLAEIAAVFKVTESRICQVHTQAIRNLRIIMERKLSQI